jgi:hypothetical protein
MIFSDTALVEIQGDLVLRFVGFVDREPTCAEYTVLGFDERVIIRDYRTSGLRAIDHALESRDASGFPNDFNGLAFVQITDLGNDGPVLIKIKDADTYRADPEFKLWIVVGLSEKIPFYPYLFSRVSQTEPNKYALVAIYQLNYQSEFLEVVPVS